MFCQKCGKELANDARFCDGCGEQVVQTTVTEVTETENETYSISTLITMLVEAKKYCVAANNHADYIEELEKQKKHKEDCITKLPGAKAVATIIAAVVCVPLAVSNFINAGSSDLFMMLASLWFKFLGVVFSVAALVCLGMSVYYIYRAVSGNKKEEAEIAALSEKIEAEWQVFRDIGNREDLKAPFSVFSMLFTKWVFPDEIEYLIDVLNSGRASSFKEALLRLDEKTHREKIERALGRTAEYARQTAENSAVAASAACDAAASAAQAANTANRIYYK